MLTKEDIQNLIEAEKEIFPTKVDFENLRVDFRTLQSSVDAYAKQAKLYFEEMLVLTRRIDRMENWIKEAAGKIGIDYKT